MIHKEENYKVIAPDGHEYGPVDSETIKCWYLEDRINKEAMVFSVNRNLWMRLSQAFNLQDWESHREAPPVMHPPSPPPQPSFQSREREVENNPSEFITEPTSTQQQRPGLKLAAWMILIDGIVGYLLQVAEQADNRKTGIPSTVGRLLKSRGTP
jgi:hypothetical protein